VEIVTTGTVTVRARVENLADLYDGQRDRVPPDQIRAVEVPDAPVDTEATLLSLPRRVIEQLGLSRQRTHRARTAAGIISFGIYDAVRLTVQQRNCVTEVAEVPDDCPVIIGQIPLESLDFVVDPKGQKLIGNPDHGGEQMIDLF